MQRRYRNTTTGRQRSYARTTSTGTAIASVRLWLPSDMSNFSVPRFWFDASDASTITIATGVSEWRDKSIYGRHATQSTSGNQPTLITNELNGRNVIRLDGTDDFFNFDGNVLGQSRYTVYTVVSRRSNKTENYYISAAGAGSGSRLTLGWNTNTNYLFAMEANDLGYVVAGYSTPSWDIWGHFTDTAGKKIILNGTQVANNNQTSVQTQNPNAYIGRYGTTSYYNGDIAEIIMCRGDILSTNRVLIEGYLAWKWGLQDKLPAGHLYKNAAPTTTS